MLQQLLNFLVAHWQIVGGLFLYALVAAIQTMPVPGEPVKAYPWFYAWSHTLINSPGAAKFRSPSPVQEPILPAKV